MNSPQKHLVFSESNYGLIDSITIEAPPNSPNTDGIHLDKCTNIIVQNSNVNTGKNNLFNYLNLNGLSNNKLNYV